MRGQWWLARKELPCREKHGQLRLAGTETIKWQSGWGNANGPEHGGPSRRTRWNQLLLTEAFYSQPSSNTTTAGRIPEPDSTPQLWAHTDRKAHQ